MQMPSRGGVHTCVAHFAGEALAVPLRPEGTDGLRGQTGDE